MARPCTVCQKQERALIDLKLMRGDTATSIANTYSLKIDSVLRHKASHLKKPSESDTSALMKSVIAELDELAVTAMARNDHRAAIDARKRKADLALVLMQQHEQKEKAAEAVRGGMGLNEAWKRIDYRLIDAVLLGIEESFDLCPRCGAYSLPKATGKMSGISLELIDDKAVPKSN